MTEKLHKTPIFTGNPGKISPEAEKLAVQKENAEMTQESSSVPKVPENENIEADFFNMPQNSSNLPQMAVDILLAAIEDGEVRFVEPEHITIDRPPNHDWNGKSFVVISEDVSTGSPHQHGIGPLRTPLVIRAWGETRALAAELCKEAAAAILTGFGRLARKGVGIHGAFADGSRIEGKKNAKYHGGSRNENVAVRFVIVINSIN